MTEKIFNSGVFQVQDSLENVVEFPLRKIATRRFNPRTTLHLTDYASAERGEERKLLEPTREEIDAKIAASEARTDTKFADLRGDMRLVLERLATVATDIAAMKGTVGAEVASMKDDNRATRSTVINTGLALFGALIGVAAISAAFWYNGTVIFDHLHPH